ncbi:hypothetical protein BJF78_14390 [Pseudonocardia sp. CNS-139]|nr:hypothetical protein BJF78_14390 [Pseudonocardia sp. CNS-139]
MGSQTLDGPAGGHRNSPAGAPSVTGDAPGFPPVAPGSGAVVAVDSGALNQAIAASGTAGDTAVRAQGSAPATAASSSYGVGPWGDRRG